MKLLYTLAKIKAPIVSVHPDPLVDEDGVFGFSMEQLVGVELQALQACIDDIREAITKIHSTGIVHNDFHPGNILQQSDGTLIAVDFGRSGLTGHDIPISKRSPLWKEPKFSFEADKSVFKFI